MHHHAHDSGQVLRQACHMYLRPGGPGSVDVAGPDGQQILSAVLLVPSGWL